MRTHGMLLPFGIVLATVFTASAGCGGKGTGSGGASSTTSGTKSSTSTSTGTTGTTTGTAGAGGTGTTTTTSTGMGGTGTTTSTSSSTGTGGTIAGGVAKFPDTTSTISLLVDQLPDGMTAGQQNFVATHFVGSQKLTLNISGPLRALNPSFIVLHYHLAIWQSAPGVTFILDGMTWSNDYPTVNMHESWFWH